MKDLPYNTPLTADDLRPLGIEAPFSFGMKGRTRFGELDVMNHINNTAYLKWLEDFRLSYFAAYGLIDRPQNAPRIVLKSIGMNFHKEMVLHEDYIITGRTASMRTTSFVMEYAVWSGDLRATGHAVLVWLTDDGVKYPLPAAVRQTFKDRDGAVDDAAA
ncbi:MAG: acyl-CoA thioesterase [Planktomarina sp.]